MFRLLSFASLALLVIAAMFFATPSDAEARTYTRTITRHNGTSRTVTRGSLLGLFHRSVSVSRPAAAAPAPSAIPHPLPAGPATPTTPQKNTSTERRGNDAPQTVYD